MQPHQPPSVATCPVHRLAEMGGAVLPQDRLVLPAHRSVVAQYATGEAGARELRLYHGDKEVSFDEPAHFAFGEALARQARFTADEATRWGPGYPWAEVQPLLGELLAAGVLRHARADEAEDPGHPLTGARPAPLPPGPCTRPRAWAEGESLMLELTGRPLELAWLELVVPVFRVAHIALDADGRQVGEANVFPKALRLPVPTNWRACIYAGTRYQPDRPMNVTALKAMRQHWGLMMLGLQRVRGAFLNREPLAASGWTVGQLERLATCVLALPSYLLMRQTPPVAQGPLHPALSSMFRVTDGLRMTLHQMLFVPIGEPALAADAPVHSAQIFDYAERNHAFHSEHGVCAGPRSMIEEFLAVLVDGAEVPAAQQAVPDEDFLAALDAIEPALDYALLGLRAHAAAFTIWPLMAASYEQLARQARQWAPQGGTAVQALAERLEGHVQTLRTSTYLGAEALRHQRMAVYGDMHAQCGRGLAGRGVVLDPTPLAQLLAPQEAAHHADVQAQLLARVRERLGGVDGTPESPAAAWVQHVMAFLVQTQAVLRAAAAAQRQVSALLGRWPAQRAFTAADLDLHNLLQGAAERRLPYLIDELGALLGVQIEVEADAIRVQALPNPPGAAAPAAHRPHSAGTVPTEARA